MWEAQDKPAGMLKPEQVTQIKVALQKGARLLLTLDASPGASPLLLREVLPATGWSTQVRLNRYSKREPLTVSEVDPGFLDMALVGWEIPFCLDIRPMPAVERGQSRYERYDFVDPWLHKPVAARSDFWTRSLLNREWIVRARCHDLAHSPLLVTGRYGAGRVVVIGTSATGIGETANASTFWSCLLHWLSESEATADASAAAPEVRASIAGEQASVTLTNHAPRPACYQLILRALAAGGEILADNAAEQQHRVMLGPHATSKLQLPLPRYSALTDASVEPGCSLQVRVGILSNDGSSLLAERRLFAPSSAVRLELRTDNLYSLAYPFHAPGPDALDGFRGRMGAFVGAYSYAPGDVIRGRVILTNGQTNLALTSQVSDLTNEKNRSVMALNDGASGFRKSPSDKIDGYSMWTGTKGDNALRFVLQEKSYVSAITITGAFGEFGSAVNHLPARVIVEVDNKEVAVDDALDSAFAASFGEARISFAPIAGSTVTIRFPWVETRGNVQRQEPWLYEIQIAGCTVMPETQEGTLAIHLVDANTGQRSEVLSQARRLEPLSYQPIDYTVPLPKHDGIGFYRLEASFDSASASAPVLTIQATRPLLPLTDLRPRKSAGVGLNVTRGFREFAYPGTGTAEEWPGWGTPDDLVWAYSRMLKETPIKAPGVTARLYLNQTDMRHYSTPWCSFPNGVLFVSDGAPRIAAHLQQHRNWTASKIVQLTFADRWDTGPDMNSLNGWQDYVEFDKFLRSTRGGGLTERTHEAIGKEISTAHQSQWQTWQLERYVRGIRSLRTAFEAAGKTLVISAQGVPMVAGEAGQELSLTIRGMQDDSTWSMLDESPVLTTGRQMSELAFNPVWQMTTLVPWGFNSPIFNNWQWHNPVGTIEPTRRHVYDRAWRATLWSGGRYASVYTYGFSSNVGTAYTMTPQDYQQWWYLQERHSLFAPDAPLGAGLVISTARYSDPKNLRFDCGDPLNLPEALLLTKSFQNLHNAGVSLPFAANASSLHEYTGSAPLILLNVNDFSATEVAALRALHERGVLLAAFAQRATLSAPLADLFAKAGTLLLEASPDMLSREGALKAADDLRTALQLPIRFPDGTAGYGFQSQDMIFVVVEDWLEQARETEVQILKSRGAKTASACDVNDHRQLRVVDAGSVWSIHVPIRSGDGLLIALKEEPSGS